MRTTLTIVFTFALTAVAAAPRAQPSADSVPPRSTVEPTVAIAIHAGAGVIARESMGAKRERVIRATLARAVRAGHQVLVGGGLAIDAVTASIRILEDASEFNAGRGAVLTGEGRIEMDASIMTGHDLNAGAVAGVRGIRHPILAARAVLEHSPHVMLSGRGAQEFARRHGLEFKPEEWFMTEFRRRQLEQARAVGESAAASEAPGDQWFSTVGTVALDTHGNLAAGTSTGGMTNKRFGRVGDSPIIGAGTYADNESCAVSATGHGEFFIRHAVAHEICARMRHGGASLAESAEAVVNGVLAETGGDGGVIALDADGHIAMPFNTPGMYRASIDPDGKLTVAIYGDE